MTERLVDVTDRFGNVKHTFPVSLDGQENPDAYYEKALLAATFADVAPDEELQPLSAKDHVSRSGPLEPYGDPLPAAAETKPALEQDIRERAYFLWGGMVVQKGVASIIGTARCTNTSRNAPTFCGSRRVFVKAMQTRTGSKPVSSRSNDRLLKHTKTL